MTGEDLPKLTRADLDEWLRAVREDLDTVEAEHDALLSTEAWILAELDALPRMLRDGRQRRSIPVEEVRDFIRRQSPQGVTVSRIAARFDIGLAQAKARVDELLEAKALMTIVPDDGTARRYSIDPASKGEQGRRSRRLRDRRRGPDSSGAIPYTGRASEAVLRKKGVNSHILHQKAEKRKRK